MTSVITGQDGAEAKDRASYRRVGDDDLVAVLAMFARCSKQTLYRRFHGITDGRSYVGQLAADANQVTLGAWVGLDCVGIATLAPAGDRHDLGVVIEDDWQHHGLGTALVAHLVGWARVQGIRAIGADVLAESSFVLQTLARIGPMESALLWGVVSVRVAL